MTSGQNLQSAKSKFERWLSFIPLRVGETIISSTEFHDTLVLRYARIPSNLPISCDDRGEFKTFDTNYALDCKKGGLVTARHENIRDELRDLLAYTYLI